MAIDWQRPEYAQALPEWQLVDKVCDERDLGSLLPYLNKHDTSDANKERNEFYRDRASWFGASQMTLAGLIGIAFDDAPEIELPGVMEYMRTNCDGEGVDLQQQMQAVTGQVLRKGRCGLFVTYPEREGDTSVADQVSGNAVATIHQIDANRIFNWWTIQDGAEVKLGGVIFSDTLQEVDDYEVKETPAIRELALENGVFVDRTWVQSSDNRQKWEPLKQAIPLDGAGNSWRVIPFTFVGALNNTAHMDRPPMLSLARLNRDHYRNSADNEESVWYAGQAQPFIEGGDTTQEDIQTAQNSGFYIGSRQLIVGKLGFAQASPETGARQAMLDKVEAMKALGARFLQPGTVAKTATESSGEQKVQHSILSLVVANVEDAYNACLRFASEYMRAPEATVSMSRDFMNPEVTVEMIDRIVGLMDRAALGYADVLPMLKRAKMIDEEKTPEEYLDEVAERGGLMPPRDDGQ